MPAVISLSKSSQYTSFQGGNSIRYPSRQGKQEKSDFDGRFFCTQHYPVSLFLRDCGFYEPLSNTSAPLDGGLIYYQSRSLPVGRQRDSGGIKRTSSSKSHLWTDVCLWPCPWRGSVEPKKADLLTYEENQFGWAKEYLLEGSLDTVANQPGTALIVYEPKPRSKLVIPSPWTLAGRISSSR